MAARTTKPTIEDADFVSGDSVSGDDELIAAVASPPAQDAAPQIDETPTPPLTPTDSPEPSPPIVDTYSGQGGSYVLDPETGIRTLVERTLPPTL